MRQFHKLKILTQYATAKIVGDKPWEIRINDRNFQKGDIICYQAVEDKGNGMGIMPVNHIINSKIYEILYVYSGDGLEKGVVIFSDRDITEEFKQNKDKYVSEDYVPD